MLISETENSQQLPGHTLGYVYTVIYIYIYIMYMYIYYIYSYIYIILVWISTYIELYMLQSILS